MRDFAASPGTGVLFHRPEATGAQPTHAGVLVLDRDMRRGEAVKIFAWPKLDANGQMFFGLGIGREQR